jgi:anthranilate phosphoribosyltransferase
LRETLRRVANGEVLTEGEAERALETIMEGDAPPAATAALLTALRVRGERVPEIVGFARAMRRFAARVEAPDGVVDTCGTGGDAKGTINVSTAAAFVARGAGVVVAKHGNRAATSQAGSADVLEALGAEIELSPEKVSRCIAEAGLGFMFARTHHPAMRFVAPVRAELPFRTVFNLLGPLTNPDGMDEITVTDKTLVADVSGAAIEEYEISPEDFGLPRHAPDGLLGGDAHLNARILRDILTGEERGATLDIVLLNAGAAIHVSGKAKTVEEGVRLARDSISDGAAASALENFIRTTRRLSGTV